MKNIAIIAGGYSSEYVVSVKSAQGIYSFIDKDRYNLFIVILTKDDWKVQLSETSYADVDKNDFSFMREGEKILFHFAYITIHGTPGEDGKLQGYLDMLGIPYSSSGTTASALTFNKYICNNYLKSLGVKTSPSIRLAKGETISDEEVVRRLGLPVFIKPNDGGSSFGTTKVKSNEGIQTAIRTAFAEGSEIMIETFMPGTELTCGCYKVRGETIVLPITEVVSKNEFFDFEAKYTVDKAEEITPARIPEVLSKEIKELTALIYDYVGAKGIIRVDYVVSPEGEVKMLEVNTTPGMTPTSFIPQQIRAAGLNMQDVMTDIIESELKNTKTH